MFLNKVTVLGFLGHILPSAFSRLIVTLPDGSVQAKLMISHNSHPFWGFQGIPYAQPPVGPLRWLPPQPSLGWNGTIDGSVSPPMCVQGVPDTDSFSSKTWIPSARLGYEDCLIVNVYTTAVEISEMNSLVPVLVWFHGGGLASGEAGMYGADFLIEYGIVVVTVNYRLGPWGELSLDSSTISGNQGLRDQTLALEWVQNNIHLFGGDSSKVTIAGESAGSWSVFHHILSPISEGLFRAVIGQSGTMISQLADTSMTREEAAENGKLFAQEVGCYDGAAWDAEVVEFCLREKTSDELFQAYTTGTFRSRGSVDGFSEFEPVLPDLPDNLLKNGQFNKVPVLVGSNSGEGILNSGKYILQPELLWEEFADETHWDEVMGPFYIFDRIPALNKTDYGPCDVLASQEARQFYFEGNITADDLKQFINLNTDVQFWYGTDKMINYLAPYTPVFHYIMYFQDLFSFTTNPNILGRDLGVSHADELAYMWDIFGLNAGTGIYDIWWSEANKLNSKRMLEMWTNFVKYLDPTSSEQSSDNLGEVKWEAVTPEDHKYLRIDSELTMEMTQEYLDRMQFWKNTLELCQTL